jgi:Fe-S-cluster-containing dehydrogenase component
MEKHIEVSMEKCTGCKLCELACSAIKMGRFNPRDSRIQVVLVGLPEIPVPILTDSCDYCGGNPACVQLCVPQAIVWKDLEARPARPKLSEATLIAERWLASVTQ